MESELTVRIRIVAVMMMMGAVNIFLVILTKQPV